MRDETKKKDGSLKKVYKDLPRYPAIIQYEKVMKNKLSLMAKRMTKSLGEKLKTFKK